MTRKWLVVVIATTTKGRALMRGNASVVLAGLALFVALSGASYATLALPKNSVTTKQVKDHSLFRRDFKRGQVPQGPAGPDGAPGQPGPQGAQGPAGIANISYSTGNAMGQCGNGGGGCQVTSADAFCPGGTVAIGGGFHATGTDQVIVWDAAVSGNHWGVIAINYDSSGQSVTAHIICASGPGVSAQASKVSAYHEALRSAKAEMP